MSAKRNQDGQAIAELTVALVGILAVFCGFLLISNLSIKNVHNIIDARGEADDNSINSRVANVGHSISSWGSGDDNNMYTADDTLNPTAIIDPSYFSGELQNSDFSLNNDFSMTYVGDNFAPNVGDPGFIFLTAANLTSGEASSTVSLDDLTRFLYVDSPSITLEDEVYMPFTGDN
jgi:hypothetical protein